MLSYWEKQSFAKTDIVIIGSGITGLSTAVSLKELNPSLCITIVDRGIFPTGASTKNAGFACVGSISEIVDDLKTMSEEQVVHLVSMRKEGLDLLRKRLGDQQIDYQQNGSYELIFKEQLPVLDEIDRINTLLQPIFGKKVFHIDRSKKELFAFSSDVEHIISSAAEGQLDTGRMMKQLIQLAAQMNIQILTGVEVSKYTHAQNEIHVHIQSLQERKIVLTCNKLAICTNAFAQQLLPELNVVPGRGQVLITEPVPHLPFKGIFHFDKGYYYFRNVGNRILLGGGRNIDIENETTAEFQITDTIQDKLEHYLQHVILPNQSIRIEQRWAGIMGFGSIKEPIIQQIDAGVYAAVRMGGMGIAIGSIIGKKLANRLLTDC